MLMPAGAAGEAAGPGPGTLGRRDSERSAAWRGSERAGMAPGQGEKVSETTEMRGRLH